MILGLNDSNLSSNFITDEQITWLKEKLNTYRNQRVFLLFHVFMDPTGNVNSLYPYTKMSGQQATKLSDMLTHFKNVIFMSGHSHLDYRLQKYGANANISLNNDTCHRIHTPSGSRPRGNDTGTSSGDTYNDLEGCEGAIVEVYQNGLIIQGRDFEIDKDLPIARYYLDTSIINVDEYTEEEGNVITPTMEYGNINYRTDGTLADSNEYIRTADYVEIDQSKTYRLNNTTTDAQNNLCVFYNASKEFITGWNVDAEGTYNHKYVVNGETITPPENAKYIKVRISTTDLSTVLTIEEV